MTRQELRRATESYGELGRGIKLLFSPQELWRVMKSYGELRRAMGRKVHITFEHEQTRSMESFREFIRAMGVAESNGLIF